MFCQAKTSLGDFTFLKSEDLIGDFLRCGELWDEDCIIENSMLLGEEKCVFLDVGAHIGCWSVAMAKLKDNLHVIAFEMQPEVFQCLEKNIEDNGLTTRVKAFNFAVGNNHGAEICIEDGCRDGATPNQAIDFSSDTNRFNIGGVQIGQGQRKAKMISLDEFFKVIDLGGMNIKFIKIDTEGSEPLVLFGARELIKTHRPYIFYEKNHKVITDSMRSVVDIPAEVEKFDITEFCFSIGYKTRVNMRNDNYLLIP